MGFRCHFITRGHYLDDILWFGDSLLKGSYSMLPLESLLAQGVGVAAVSEGKVIGSLVGTFHADSAFCSYGTFVHPKHRKCGVAKRMWTKLLRDTKAKKVEVVAVSDRGWTLMKSLEQQFPRVDFDLGEEGGRKLRDLKKREGAG